jgi:hypothetical protein
MSSPASRLGRNRRLPPPDAPKQKQSGNLGDRRGKPPSHGGWKPGQSGNPAGRPKTVDDVSAIARSYGREALERVVTAMRNPDDKIAVPAAIALWDRGYGKPNIRVETGGPQSITVLHLVAAREVSEEIQRALEAANGTTPPPTIDAEPSQEPPDLCAPALE